MMTREFSYVPDGLKRLPISRLHEHEYWGHNYAAGKMEFALFEKEKGGYTIVATYGTWDSLQHDEICLFRHDQTRRPIFMRFLNLLPYGDREVHDLINGRAVSVWTLK